MMNPQSMTLYDTIAHDFEHMRQKARWHQLQAQLVGESASLLDYDEVLQTLGAYDMSEPFVAEIALDQIRGSVGRAKEFTSKFYPRNNGSSDRWIGVKMAVVNMCGLRPIDVYQIDDVYFVQDGNHRVSVARQLGVETITARVTKVYTKCSLAERYQVEAAGLLARFRHWLRPRGKHTAVVCETN